MTAKHTPGQWVAGDAYVEGADRFAIRHEDGALLGIVWEGERSDGALVTNDEADANGRLMVAAPDLLAALQKIHTNAAESVEWIRRVIDEAIARATGGDK